METDNQARTTEFVATRTNIPGLLVFSVNVVGDERGWFQEKFQKEKLVASGLPEDFMPLQHSVSYNEKPGVTRGFHAEPWSKYVGVITGKVFAAYVDLRNGPSFGTVVTVELDEQTTVFVPKGVANSFQCIAANTYYSYLVSDIWRPEKVSEYKFVNLADPTLAIPWPISLSDAILSDRDRNHPMLADVTPFDA